MDQPAFAERLEAMRAEAPQRLLPFLIEDECWALQLFDEANCDSQPYVQECNFVERD